MKINRISVDGNNNVVIQDVTGSHIYVNNNEDALRLCQEFRNDLVEIRRSLKGLNNPDASQFAEKIYEIANINNANFYGETRVKVDYIGKLTLDSRSLTKEQREHFTFLNGIKKRYQRILSLKMNSELRFDIEINLNYSTEGAEATYIKDYFIDNYQDAKTTRFDELFKDYRDVVKRLLIIGEAGSGKSVLLIKFILELIEEALNSFDYPIPVLVSLATYSEDYLSFEEWLIDCIVRDSGEFGSNRTLAKKLVESKNIILLLDGFDEIASVDLHKFNGLLLDYMMKLESQRPIDRNFPSLIITSRKRTYLESEATLPVRGIIDIAPLNPASIFGELTRLKDRQDTLAKVLFNRFVEYPEIPKLLRSAFEVQLTLSMAESLNFENFSIDSLVKEYVDKEIRKVKRPATKTAKYLRYIGTKMQERHLGLSFELSYLQPNWLKSPSFFLLFYTSIKTFLIFNLLMTGSFMLALLALINDSFGNSLRTYLKETGLIDLYYEFLIEDLETTPNDFFENITYLFFFYLLFIFISLIFYWLGEVIYYSIFKDKLIIDVKNKKFVLIGSIFVRNAKKVVSNSLKYSAVFAFILFILISLLSDSFSQFLEFFLLLFSLVFLVVIVYGTPELFYISQRKLNLRRPYSNLFMDISYMMGSFLIISAFSLIYELVSFGKIYTINGLFFLYYILFYFVIVLHRIAILKHVILRLVLFIGGKIPFRLRKFMNDVSNTGLMYKYGGQWRFRHQDIFDELTR